MPPKKLLLVVMLFAAFTLSGKCSLIEVSGNVSGIWDVDSVMVTGPIRVPSGDTLFINAGTTVYVMCSSMDYVFRVEGVLIATGRPENPVVFTRGDLWLFWHIDFHNSAYGNFTYCDFLYGRWGYNSGGAIASDSSSIDLNHCQFISCGALYSGGAIYCSYSNLRLSNSLISENYLGDYPENPDACGAGIYCDHCDTVIIVNNQIIGNVIMGYGFNISSSRGGGIFLANSLQPARISGNIVADNIASSNAGYVGIAVGGGIYCDRAYIENNTVVNNAVRCEGQAYLLSGGGLAAEPGDTVLNSIIWLNWADSSTEIYGNPQVTYSCVNGGWLGDGNFDLDPQFCNQDIDDFHISGHSPCVHGGNGGSLVGALGVGCDTDAVYIDPVEPRDFYLYGCYPNPFNMATTIGFDLLKSGHVLITVYDLTGGLIETIVDDEFHAGYYRVAWKPQNISSGIYFYRVSTGNLSQTRKMLLLK